MRVFIRSHRGNLGPEREEKQSDWIEQIPTPSGVCVVASILRGTTLLGVWVEEQSGGVVFGRRGTIFGVKDIHDRPVFGMPGAVQSPPLDVTDEAVFRVVRGKGITDEVRIEREPQTGA